MRISLQVSGVKYMALYFVRTPLSLRVYALRSQLFEGCLLIYAFFFWRGGPREDGVFLYCAKMDFSPLRVKK